MKIAIDLDSTITASRESSEFFSILTNLLIAEHKIYILSNTEEESEQDIACYLDYLGVDYNEIVITDKKADYIKNNRISIYFGNRDRSFLELGEKVTVFEIR